METPPAKLVQNIIKILILKKQKIIFYCLGAMILGLVISLVKPKVYKAETAFILKNHLFADRSYLYSKDMRYINYYAPEDDIERLIALIDADSVIDILIKDLDLIKYYEVDTLNKPKAMRLLKKTIAKKVKIIRTPEKNAELSYKDENADTAAIIANKYLELIEKTLRKNYNKVRQDVLFSLQTKIRDEDSVLTVLSDSLARMRQYYRIYDIINPTRGNMMLNMHITDNGHPEFAKGLELIQNIESVKDRMVADRSDHISLANQYTNSTQLNDLSLIQIIRVAEPPLKTSGLGIIATSLLCGLAGFVFCILLVLLQYRLQSKNENE
jgi:hypothetical protein